MPSVPHTLIGTAGMGGLSRKQYASQRDLNFLELDDTYYAPANWNSALRWYNRGLRYREAGIYVVNKLSRDARSLEPDELVTKLLCNVVPFLSSMRDHYVGLLVQLAPRFGASTENVNRLKNAATVFHRIMDGHGCNKKERPNFFVEFRNVEWTSYWPSLKAMSKFCHRHRVSPVMVAATGPWNPLSRGERKLQFWPARAPKLASSAFVYIRLHGKTGRYKGWYDPKKILAAMEKARLSSHRRILVFNNTMWGEVDRPKNVPVSIANKRCLSRANGCSTCNAIAMAATLHVKKSSPA